ncbi:hypothetical protein KXQ82_12545 [Mucilaginibacter sp. HMF5004]|uniref:hypothetical protein n=1 Tax=Mucilaginibacter rivuli TaxID=2857527 RepID=UPI001C5D83DB|nr:hypothetical protein [Mucilaginibacter rivuli]MBW4890556.1 hypothetical protein [Mucilaginibacter rivuli]
MLKQTQIVKNKPTSVHALYEEYAGMLLGYIFEVVNDMELAEAYLVKVFSTISRQFNDTNWSGSGTWLQLRRFAKNELTHFYSAVQSCDPADTQYPKNKYFADMTANQKHIFCSIYYHKATVAQLSAQMGEPEAYINKMLKEAFAIIKQQHES